MSESDTIPRFDRRTRELAHRVVDLLFDHVENIREQPVVDWQSSDELRRRFAVGEEPLDDDRLVEKIAELARSSIQIHHPSYMGHQVCPPFPTGVIGDLVISTLNQSTAVWEMSPAATIIEQQIVRWLIDRVGYPADAAGTAVSGGSAANLTALLAARARLQHEEAGRKRTPVILCSESTHYSVARAASILGLGPSSVVKIPVGRDYRMDADALVRELDGVEASESHAAMAIVATAGSTATGSFDRLG
ncbi:MAG: pyridoxal-dependent decarboxylase, partial [Thermoanaerobaculia bacterium]